jgi:hypothetical protein
MRHQLLEELFVRWMPRATERIDDGKPRYRRDNDRRGNKQQQAPESRRSQPAVAPPSRSFVERWISHACIACHVGLSPLVCGGRASVRSLRWSRYFNFAGFTKRPVRRRRI